MKTLRQLIIEEIRESNPECCAPTLAILYDVISFEMACTLQEIKDELHRLSEEGIVKKINDPFHLSPIYIEAG